MYNNYRVLKQLEKVSINLDGTQPELSRILHSESTGEVRPEPRIDVINVGSLTEIRANLLDSIKDIDVLLVDVANAIAAKAHELKLPPELP